MCPTDPNPITPAEDRRIESPEPRNRAERRLRNREHAARHFQVTEQTVTNWHERGYIIGYKADARTILYDIDEIERALKIYPRSRMRDGRRLGSKGRVVVLSAQPVRVPAVSDEAGQ